MFNMFSPEASAELNEIIQKGDVSDFVRALNDAGGDPSGLLYARARRTAWPLIKRVLDAPFKASRLEAQLEMGRHLLRLGADTHISAPWGQSIVGHLANCVRRQARWQDRLVLLRFIAEIVDVWSPALHIRSKSESTDLDEVFGHASWEFSHGAGEMMAKAALEVAKVLIESKAPATRQEEYARYTQQVARGHVRLTHDEALQIEAVAARAVHRRAPLRAFERATPFAGELMADNLKLAWDDVEHPRHAALRAVAVIRDRAFRHHGWGWGAAEDASVGILTDVLDALTDKGDRRALKKCMTKLSKVDKPVFDEELYALAARLVTESAASRAVAGLPG